MFSHRPVSDFSRGRNGLATWTGRAIGTSSRGPVAGPIHAALVATPSGLSRTQIRDLFARNEPAIAIDQALASLAQAGRATVTRPATGGRLHVFVAGNTYAWKAEMKGGSSTTARPPCSDLDPQVTART